MKTLSIRHPWAWLIINGHKDIENRSRNIGNHLGPILIHAGQTMTKDDYQACVLFLNATFDRRGWSLPPYHSLRESCGGIVGMATIKAHGCLDHTSPWWTGGYWYLLQQTQTLPFLPCKGRLGFFNVGPGGAQ